MQTKGITPGFNYDDPNIYEETELWCSVGFLRSKTCFEAFIPAPHFVHERLRRVSARRAERNAPPGTYFPAETASALVSLLLHDSLLSIANANQFNYSTFVDEDPIVFNGYFEDHAYTNTTSWRVREASAVVSGWVCGGNNTVVLVRQPDPTWGSLNSGDGSFHLAMQGPATFCGTSLTGLTVGMTYWLSAKIARRAVDQDGAILQLLLNTSAVTSYFDYANMTVLYSGSPPSADFETQMIGFTATSTDASLTVLNASPFGDYTVFVDKIIITDGNPKVLNGDFEEDTGVGKWKYMQDITGWSGFGSRALVSSEYPDWGGLNSGSGKYYVAIQDSDDYVEQTVEGFSTNGEYTATFLYAARPLVCGTCIVGAELGFYVDGVLIEKMIPNYTAFELYTYGPFVPTSSEVTFKFMNTATSGDKAVFVDNLRVPGGPKDLLVTLQHPIILPQIR
ncbi:hypothetical protein CYMTET_28171 [Cymbomonas tetramitiformis]|uniref:Uncharacterized protein n=1 Tax=Cymbomonas tetramitiformis TaxID=36881 RepID=A0AAE0FNC7_9CHLO|nr:hypothetical protein CYMTET_28171 [Cymbomonas tetramitiformis]